jgi:hypothetical protein
MDRAFDDPINQFERFVALRQRFGARMGAAGPIIPQTSGISDDGSG